MSVLSDLEAKLSIVETDVVHFFKITLPDVEAHIAADLQKVAIAFDNGVQWMSAHGQEIAADVAGIIGLVAATGTPIPAAVITAAGALNTAVNLVNIALSAQQRSAAAGGSELAQAIASGSAAYQALKTAQSATAQAQAQVATGK
jgi:hypothetical protein